MNESIERLLQPISEQEPCGPDLSYDPAFDELQALLKGKPEVEMGDVKKPAEPPEWGQLRSKSIKFLERSKHLEAAIILCCSLLRTEGFAGFVDGLQLIRGLLEQYWDKLYPLLDPEDNNDPTLRLNRLGALTTPRGAAAMGGSWLRFVDFVYETPLCRPPGMPPLTLAQIQAPSQTPAGEEGAPSPGPDAASLTAAMRDSADQLVACSERIAEALEAVNGIDDFLTTTLGAGTSIAFDDLESVLRQVSETVRGYLPSGEAGGEDVAEEMGVVGGEGTPSGVVGIQVTGSIRSRADVVRVLDSICDYYRQVEPGSPVPYLLRRAQKLAEMSFVQAVQELSGDASPMRASLGSAVDTETSTGEVPQ